MMKNRCNPFSLWIIAVFLSLIVLPIAFQDAYAVEAIITSSTVSSSTVSSDRTVTIVFSVPVDFVIGDFTDLNINGVARNVDSIAEASPSATVTIFYSGGAAVLTGALGDIDIAAMADVGSGNTFAGAINQILTQRKSSGTDRNIPPSYTTAFAENEYPITIGDTKFKREQLGYNNPTTVIETGKPVQVNLLIYDDEGWFQIHQVVLYTNINGIFRDVAHSDTYIIYKRGNPTTIVDPNGFFSDVIVSSSEVNGKRQITYEITFAKEMEKSDIIVQATDASRNVGKLTVSDAWQVIQAPTVVETTETPTDEPTDGSAPGEINVKTLNIEKPAYTMSEEILFFGTVDGYKSRTAVTILIRNPSNNVLTMIGTFPDKDGYFEAKTTITSKFKTDGQYTATAFVDDLNKGIHDTFYFSRSAPSLPTVTTSPVQSTQAEQSTEPEPTTTFEPVTQSEPVTPKPKPRPSFIDPEKDPQSYVDRYNNEESYKEWFDGNFPDYTIYEAVGLAEPAKEKIPGWIKNNAKWWSEGQIDDGTFVSGIQFLMKQKIVNIPDLPEQASEKARPSFVDPEEDPQSYVDRYNIEESYKEWFDKNYPDYTIEEAVGLPEPIPGWIKNNADWWSKGLITEDDFVKGIEFLVKNGIIKV